MIKTIKNIAHFFIFFFTGIEISFAQLVVVDNTSITLIGAVQLTVKGDLETKNSALINNTGIIDLSGNYTNNAGNSNFGTSTGTVILNGANQSILGTSSTTFNNLTLLGSGIKTVGVNTTVGGGNASPAGILNVGNVALALNTKTLTISNSATNAIQSSTDVLLVASLKI